MIKNQLNINENDIQEIKIYKNEGDFVNDEGREIHYENYSGTMRICGEKVKFRIDKNSKEDLDEVVEENKLLQ